MIFAELISFLLGAANPVHFGYIAASCPIDNLPEPAAIKELVVDSAVKIVTRERNDIGDPEHALVKVYRAGSATWSRAASVSKAGAVEVSVGASVSCLHSPRPQAYGGFGSQVAVAGGRLAILERATGRAYVYRLDHLEVAPYLVDKGAFTLTMTDTLLVLGAPDGIHLLDAAQQGRETTKVEWPKGAFISEGQIVLARDLLVSTTPGMSPGDGVVLPGRVDVFHRGDTGWQWEARLLPRDFAPDQPYGGKCCIAVDGDTITVADGDGKRRFVRGGDGWREAAQP